MLDRELDARGLIEVPLVYDFVILSSYPVDTRTNGHRRSATNCGLRVVELTAICGGCNAGAFGPEPVRRG